MKNIYTILMIVLLLINLALISNDILPHTPSGTIFHIIIIIALFTTVILWIRDRHKK
ncbi:hypothetical protein J3U50_07110 [Lactobacillus sp. B3795]|uniref:hypothetical protein n=1 Tax=Lactobacillus sp. B3795 TaxID=2818036 RepID=UPI00265D2771|nr:hypothetical protein [Lactobacillus sp. B3795]MCX8743759.1 hypothetical protein [Lactobacillus sp. B3795]